jgi:hypothetical protein
LIYILYYSCLKTYLANWAAFTSTWNIRKSSIWGLLIQNLLEPIDHVSESTNDRDCSCPIIMLTWLNRYKEDNTQNNQRILNSIGLSVRASYGLKTKEYKIGIHWFFAKHTTLKSKNKDCLARNQNNMSEWSDMSIRGLLFPWANTIQIQLSVLVTAHAQL